MGRYFGWGSRWNRGDDTLDGNAGNNLIFGGRGNDVINGNGGHDWLFGGRGSDIVNGGSGNDFVSGGSGSDIVSGGSGNDRVYGGRGDDEAIYTLADNSGDSDYYNGGRGEDTLTLNLTAGEWAVADVQSDIADYLLFLETGPAPGCWGGRANSFEFTAFDLTARSFEHLKVVVDGVEIDPTDTGPTNADPTVEGPIVLGDVSEDDPRISLDLLEGASDADGDTLSADGISASFLDTNGNSGNVPIIFDLGGGVSIDPGQFSGLEDGESALVTVSYTIEDGNGGSVEQTIEVTINGVSDAAFASASSGSMQLSANSNGEPVEIDAAMLGQSDDADPAESETAGDDAPMAPQDDFSMVSSDDLMI